MLDVTLLRLRAVTVTVTVTVTEAENVTQHNEPYQYSM